MWVVLPCPVNNPNWGLDALKNMNVIAVNNFWQSSRYPETRRRQNVTDVVDETSLWAALLAHAAEGPTAALAASQGDAEEIATAQTPPASAVLPRWRMTSKQAQRPAGLPWPKDVFGESWAAELASVPDFESSQFHKRFKLARFADNGTYGKVYHAVDLTAPWGKGGCVVKVQQKQRAGGASGFSLDEVPIFAASQGHANNAKLLDAWLSPGIFMIAMADAGKPLSHFLKEQQPNQTVPGCEGATA